jgi:C-terminal processing protease CtpA/Prc
LTTAKFYSPSGRAISKNGVLPTTQIQVTAKVPVAQMGSMENDSVLNSAVQVSVRQMSASQSQPQNLGLTITQSNLGG